jgi:hypothetical protein
MRSRYIALLAVFALSAGAVRPLLAQSLADVARKEEERRKSIKTPAKVLTGSDLKPVPVVGPDGSTEPADQDGSKKADDKADATGDKADKKADESKEPVKDQKYWSDRQSQLQAKLQRDQTFADALQSRLNALTTDFVNRDDPAQRAVVAADRQKALDDLNQVKKEIADDQKALADLQEEARRAGVPPGWLR